MYSYTQLYSHVQLGLHTLLRWRQTVALLLPSLLDLHCKKIRLFYKGQKIIVINSLIMQYNLLPMQHIRMLLISIAGVLPWCIPPWGLVVLYKVVTLDTNVYNDHPSGIWGAVCAKIKLENFGTNGAPYREGYNYYRSVLQIHFPFCNLSLSTKHRGAYMQDGKFSFMIMPSLCGGLCVE